MNAFFNDWLRAYRRKAGMVLSAAMVLALLSATGAARAEVGSTGQPRSWVQIGETKDTVLQIDTHSITGFESPTFGMAHRSDYRFKGKSSDRLTSRARTAFMVQKECDEQKGSLTIFSTGPQGNPVGKAESFDFELGRGTWPDAVAATMCKARKLMMDNQRVTISSSAASPGSTPTDDAQTQELGSTGQPRRWVQIGETRDTLLQIDSQSSDGFQSPKMGMVQRTDYRFKGKNNDRLTSRARTAFIVQKECDDRKGKLTTFATGPQGKPEGNGEDSDFELDRGNWPDAVAAAMCKARNLMPDNQRVNISPPAGVQASDPKNGDPAADWNFLLGLCTYETSNTSESRAVKPITECSQSMLRSLPPYQSITYEIWAPDSSLNLMYLGNVPGMPFNPKFAVQFRSTVKYEKSAKPDTILVTSKSDGCGQVQEFTLVGGRLSKREVAMIDEGCDPQTVRLAKQGAAQRSKPTELGYLRMR